ncbi:hypothetical protein DFJ58DRAFT_837796 [Suillus subalutaceus]|uniref:uncharacterized protein n=1 Tax=Suillus subalutaceus TaxID=48586 RepID=UPI001B85D9C6|nr:uncharacterized protein DFJ58DRAFT_837796 [Suillus subalutaceus]KAG1868962.1 hypothetical protein DFJ58DRAFT_837796 [Suillus subalutaceus]
MSKHSMQYITIQVIPDPGNTMHITDDKKASGKAKSNIYTVIAKLIFTNHTRYGPAYHQNLKKFCDSVTNHIMGLKTKYKKLKARFSAIGTGVLPGSRHANLFAEICSEWKCNVTFVKARLPALQMLSPPIAITPSKLICNSSLLLPPPIITIPLLFSLLLPFVMTLQLTYIFSDIHPYLLIILPALLFLVTLLRSTCEDEGMQGDDGMQNDVGVLNSPPKVVGKNSTYCCLPHLFSICSPGQQSQGVTQTSVNIAYLQHSLVIFNPTDIVIGATGW